MSVFTSISQDELARWLAQFDLGTLESFQGIAAGIENTNYFVTTSRGDFVLTIFEKLTANELPWFLDLMGHLAAHGVACPSPMPTRDGHTLTEIGGKPAALCTRMSGHSLETPDAIHAAQVGEALARMHLAGLSYPSAMPNPRGPAWWTATAPKLYPFLAPDQAALLEAEVATQAALSGLALPRGVIHADLFRDNVLFDGERLGGMIDFYFACTDCLLYDVAITVNDWCYAADGQLDAERVRALLSAYHAVRPFRADEGTAWPLILRAAALRFWVSRLYDLHYPRAGEMTYAKDPAHFEILLRRHIANRQSLEVLWKSCLTEK